MSNYKITKGSVGPWTEGTVITDADLKANPGLGGVARLRDKLSVIEDTTEQPGDKSGQPVPPELASGNPVGAAEVRRTGVVSDPNAKGRRTSAG